MLETTVEVMESSLDNAMLFGKHQGVQEMVQYLAKNESIDHIRIFNSEGIILHSSLPNEAGEKIFDIAPGHVSIKNRENEINELKILEDNNVYASIKPIYNREKCRSCHGDTDVIAYMDVDTELTTAETSFYTGTTHMVYLGIAVILILTTGLFLLFNKYINKPIRQFISAMDEVEKGNLSARLPVENEDEFGKLNFHFNKMVSEIETSRTRIEELHNEQLRHADKLATIGELTSQMAHEVNNFTGIILTRSDYLMLEAQQNESMKKYEQDLEVIQKEVIKISQLTRNVLRHSKKRSHSIEKINIIEAIEQSLFMMSPYFKKSQISIEREYKGEYYILGNNSELEQVFTNLFTNAIDAISDKGIIKISLLKDEGFIIISVDDNGKGMDQKTIDNIFSPFFTTKESDRGTGLGLYIVKNICDQYDVKITCESKLAVGTSFKLRFKEAE
ncbi:MAG: HAMP domain-containing histidine kinase [Melioribacteraceae bacterium]|nr:HAMP domain-containing histidine kinase [Melioribacteraceae bacterium]